MKKKNLLVLGLAVVMGLSVTACGGKKDSGSDSKVYAVETGSAGEEAAKAVHMHIFLHSCLLSPAPYFQQHLNVLSDGSPEKPPILYQTR